MCPRAVIKRSGSRRPRPQDRSSAIPADLRQTKILVSRISTGFAPVIDRFSTVLTMTAVPGMRWLLRVFVFAALALLPVRVAGAAPTLFRIFLTDGSDVVSYGEYARVGDDVIFSMAVGEAVDEPRLQLVTLPA